jgi:hypothetical protein
MRAGWVVRAIAGAAAIVLTVGVVTAAARLDVGPGREPTRVSALTNPRTAPLPAGVAGSTLAERSARSGSFAAVTADESRELADLAASFPPGSLARMFPAQAAATQSASDPASTYWSLIIGINDYAAPTEDTVGSRPDGAALRRYLLRQGWRSDHILFLTDTDATASRVVEAIRWLASKTDRSSTVVFHYAGHEKPYRTDVDGDGETRDVALWLSDNRLIVDARLGDELGRVRAKQMWLHFAVCRAGGFDDPVTGGPGRIVTYSSPDSELSYEDRDLRHSVFGYYTIVEGLSEGLADANRDGKVTVEEAFRYARPLTTQHTGGRQHPRVADGVGGQMSLRVPAAKGPAPTPSPSSCPLPVPCP